MVKFYVLVCASLFTALFTMGCANLSRSSGSGYGGSGSEEATPGREALDRSMKQTAYEMGKNPNGLSARDIEQIRDRQRLRQLERTLISKKEKEQYSKVLPWLRDDREKIEFLSVPSLEGRQQWINAENIWDRAKVPQEGMRQLVESQDIAVGMPQDYVKRSWGEPLTIESSGNPIYRNERWKYQRMVSSAEGYRKEVRFVYFEGGRVVGWETE